MKRVYVAGPYSGPGPREMFGNMRRGIRACTRVLMVLGCSPFCPWIDYHFALVTDVPIETFYEHSLSWLEASDVVWVLEGWENSVGTKAEIKRAKELGIPVVYSWQELETWVKKNK